MGGMVVGVSAAVATYVLVVVTLVVADAVRV
jgi:hypothetical protein